MSGYKVYGYVNIDKAKATCLSWIYERGGKQVPFLAVCEAVAPTLGDFATGVALGMLIGEGFLTQEDTDRGKLFSIPEEHMQGIKRDKAWRHQAANAKYN